MTYDNTALRDLEGRYERLQFTIADMEASIGRLQQPAVNPAGGQQNGSGSSGQLFWARAGSGVSAASGSWPTITPATFTSDIYADVGGTLTIQASSQTVRWFYKDAAASGSLIPVLPCDGGTAWDAIGNSCTAV